MLDFIRPDRENAKAVCAAFAKFGAPFAGLTADDFIKGDKHFRTGHAPAMVEIFSETKGVDFDAAYGRRPRASQLGRVCVPLLVEAYFCYRKAKMIKGKLWMVAAAFVLVCGMAQAQAPNTLTPQEKQEGWQLLFDGQDLQGWHSYLEKRPGSDWSVVDGAIQLKKTNQDPPADYADLVMDGEYSNFDLKLEWKARPCIDSGVMFDVHESPEYRNTYDTGVEMQIADLACTVPDSRILKERSGDIFDMISDKVEWVRPAGEWNQFEIIQDHGHLQLFQNGHKVIETQLWDKHWKKLIAGTKFARMPGYSKYHSGHISMQGTEPKGEPGVKICYRDIMIRKL